MLILILIPLLLLLLLLITIHKSHIVLTTYSFCFCCFAAWHYQLLLNSSVLEASGYQGKAEMLLNFCSGKFTMLKAVLQGRFKRPKTNDVFHSIRSCCFTLYNKSSTYLLLYIPITNPFFCLIFKCQELVHEQLIDT